MNSIDIIEIIDTQELFKNKRRRTRRNKAKIKSKEIYQISTRHCNENRKTINYPKCKFSTQQNISIDDDDDDERTSPNSLYKNFILSDKTWDCRPGNNNSWAKPWSVRYIGEGDEPNEKGRRHRWHKNKPHISLSVKGGLRWPYNIGRMIGQAYNNKVCREQSEEIKFHVLKEGLKRSCRIDWY